MSYSPSSIITSPLTQSGELPISEPTLYIKGSAIYGTIPSNFRTFVGTSGTATTENRQFKTTTGTDVGGFGVIRSFRALKDGYARFSVVFNEGVALSGQIAGLFNIGDGFCVGYDGVSFGVLHRYGGLPELRTLQITGGAGGSESATVFVNGTSFTIPLTSGDVQHNAFEIATYLEANLTGWNIEAVDDTVQIIAQSDGAKSGTYSFSSSSATATWSQVTAGATKTEDWIAQADFNGSVFEGFEPTNGNVYEIQYQSDGYGDVKFSVLNPETNRFVLMHSIRYGNTAVVPIVGNPSMKVGMAVFSLGSTTDMTMYAGEFKGYVSNNEPSIRNPRAYSNSKAGVTNAAFVNILTIRNGQSLNGYNNQIEIEPRLLTISTDSSKGAFIKVITNATVAGEPDFQYINEDALTAQYDITGTTVTGGREIATFDVTSGGSLPIDLQSLAIRIPATLSITIAAKIVSGAASDVNASLTWYEDV